MKKSLIMIFSFVLIFTFILGCGRKDNVKIKKPKEDHSEQIQIYVPSEKKDKLSIKYIDKKDVTKDNLITKLYDEKVIDENVKLLSYTIDEETHTLKIRLSENFKDYLQGVDKSTQYLVSSSIINTYLNYFKCDTINLNVQNEDLENNEIFNYKYDIGFIKDLNNPYYEDNTVMNDYFSASLLFDNINNNDNTVKLISPTGIYYSLSALNIGLLEENQKTINDFINTQDFLSKFNVLNNATNISTNAVFYHNSGDDVKTCTDEYVKLLSNYKISAVANNMNLSNKTLETINNWFFGKSNNLIQSATTNIPSSTQILLANLNNLNLSFTYPIVNSKFNNQDVTMLEINSDKLYLENDTASGFAMDVNNNTYKIICLTPKNNEKLSDINISQLLKDGVKTQNIAYIPAINKTNTYSGANTLKQMNLSSMFEESDIFDNLFIQKDVKTNISDLIQANILNISSTETKYSQEKQTEVVSEVSTTIPAQTSTSTEISSDNTQMQTQTETKTTINVPEIIKLDKTFYYLIVDNSNNLILYIGLYD